MMRKVVNVYGQPMEHMPATIVGNKAGLETLVEAIHQAMYYGRPFTGTGQTVNLYATDGEGYEVTVLCRDWGATDKSWQAYPAFYHRILGYDDGYSIPAR